MNQPRSKDGKFGSKKRGPRKPRQHPLFELMEGKAPKGDEQPQIEVHFCRAQDPVSVVGAMKTALGKANLVMSQSQEILGSLGDSKSEHVGDTGDYFGVTGGMNRLICLLDSVSASLAKVEIILSGGTITDQRSL